MNLVFIVKLSKALNCLQIVNRKSVTVTPVTFTNTETLCNQDTVDMFHCTLSGITSYYYTVTTQHEYTCTHTCIFILCYHDSNVMLLYIIHIGIILGNTNTIRTA